MSLIVLGTVALDTIKTPRGNSAAILEPLKRHRGKP
jgi:hypothetical protein